jgi:hypothetical protein
MKSISIAASAVLLLLSAHAHASAHYWKLAGPPEFAPSVNGDPAAEAGETKSYNDGEGGVTTTLVARTPTHAEFTTSQPRYGTHRMSYDWDAPPQIIRPGDVPTLALRWQIPQRWNRFCPQMTAFSHLDGSEDWYNTLGYGYNRPEDFKSDQNSGEFRNTTIKVADIDRAELILYRHVGCGGVWVRVLWKYTLVEGETVTRPPTTTNSRPVTPAPATPATASASTKAPAVAGGALFGVSVTSTASSVSVGDSVKTRPAVSGGTPPYTYAWFDGARRSTVTSPVVVWKTSTAGNHAYKVVVTDAAGATAQAQTTVEVTGNLDPASRGQETVLFSVDSVAGVSNNPPAKTVFTLSKPGHLSKILTYHWNGGSGSPPGTIGLRNAQTGAMAGRWTAAGSSGYDRTPGANWPLTSSAPPYRYWTVQPNCDLPAATYEILDSDPATWSYTADTGNRGIAYVFGWLPAGAAWVYGTEAKLAVIEDIQPASLVADVGRFRAVASIQPADAWKACLTEGAAQQLPGVQKSFFGSVAPAAAWSYFFHGAIFVIDPFDKEGAVALFYHPWSDTALLTLWQRIEGRSLLIRMTVVPGDVIRNPAATNLDLVPHWLRRIDTLPPSLALSATSNETLRAFLTMFPAEAADSATPIPNANRDELSKALGNGPLMKTFRAAASVRFLKCLEGVQRFEQDPALAPYRAKIATVQTQLTRGDLSGLAEASETLPETLALLLKLKPQLADFSVVAFTASPEACQMYLSQPADPKTVLMLWCETREGACRLRRADFISHDISLMLGDKLPVLIDSATAK